MQLSKRTVWILKIAVIVVAAAMLVMATRALLQAPVAEAPAAIPPEGPIAVTGTMVCLPHKNTEGPQTLECAYGLKDDAGRYFALRDTDPSYQNISGVPMNVRVTIEGMFTRTTGSNYQDIGIIVVTKITQ